MKKRNYRYNYTGTAPKLPVKPYSPIRTLADMTKKEIRELERKFGARIKKQGGLGSDG